MDEWYRYDDFWYSELRVKVSLTKYKVIRETPCGVWLVPMYYPFESGKRWVKRGARKKFACPTKEEALVSFLARKRKQIAILDAQMERARMALAEGKRIQGEADGGEGDSVHGVYKEGAGRNFG